MEDSLEAVENKELLERLYIILQCHYHTSLRDWRTMDVIDAAAKAQELLREWKQQ